MERKPKTVRLLFSDEMARATVEGRKTVTRRPCETYDASLLFRVPHGVYVKTPDETTLCKSICAPGDLLIGRECFQAWTGGEMSGYEEVEGRLDFDYAAYSFTYRADGDCSPEHWRPSIHMPDPAARIRRRVVSVTVERLQDITPAGAIAEGFAYLGDFIAAWDSIYAAKGLGWAVNPWVWPIEFSAENEPVA